jgi:hypothetical protein
MSLPSLCQPNRFVTFAPVQTRLSNRNKIWDSSCGYTVANSSCRAPARILGGVHHCIVNSMVPSTVAYSQDPSHNRSIFTTLFATFFGFCVLLRCLSDSWRSELPQDRRWSMWSLIYGAYIFYTILYMLDLTTYTALYASFSIYGYTYLYIRIIRLYASATPTY